MFVFVLQRKIPRYIIIDSKVKILSHMTLMPHSPHPQMLLLSHTSNGNFVLLAKENVYFRFCRVYVADEFPLEGRHCHVP